MDANLRSRGVDSGLRWWRAVALGTALVCFVSAAAGADDAGVVCPTREAVGAAVRALLSRSRVDARDAEETIEVQDLGERYVVTVKGRSREYTDGARDCARRARVAAVFVALTLAPPDIALPELPPEPPADRAAPPRRPAPEPLPPVPPIPAPRAWWPEVELGALGAMAPRHDRSLFVLGPELRFIVTSETWGITLGGSVATPGRLELGNVRVRQARYPLDLGVRLGWKSGWLRSALDLGVLGALLRLREADVPNAKTVTCFEPGVRAAATVSIEGPYVAPYARGFAEVVPVTREVAVEPRGRVGRTSALWLGITLGAAARFR